MTIKDQIRADINAFVKADNKLGSTTLRSVLGEIERKEKAGKTAVILSETETLAVLKKETAKRREMAVVYADAGRQESAEKESAEADIVAAYLPVELTQAEVEAIIDRAIADVKFANPDAEIGMRSMGAVMKNVTADVAGRFDGKKVSDLVKGKLG
jgi:hypothetical protein